MNTSQEISFGHDVLDKSDEMVDAKLNSRKKVKKKKKHKGVLEKSESDHGAPREVESAKPERDQCMLSSNDMVCESNHVKIPEKREGKKKSEHHVLGNSVQDQKSSQEVVNNFSQKMDTESDQVNAESCSSSKKKRKRKKENDALDKSDKDQDLQGSVMNHGLEAAGVQPVTESAELGSSRDNLIPRRQGVAKENALPIVPSSDDFVKKKDTDDDIANAELNSSNKRKAKGKKQKRVKHILNESVKDQDLPGECIQSPASKFRNLGDEVRGYGVETVGVQSVLEVAGLASRKDSSLVPEKQSDSSQNQNAREVQDVQLYRDQCQPTSNDSIKRMNTKRGHIKEETISLKESKIKRKKKKQKMGDNVLDKGDKAQDTMAEVVTVKPKTDLCLQFPDSKIIVGNRTQSIAEVAALGSGRDNFLMQEKQIVPPKSENILEVKDVQPSGVLYQSPSNDFTKIMATESEQVITELSSSNKSTLKRKKKKRGTVSLDKSDKDQDLLEGVVLNSGQEAIALQPISEVAEVGPRRGNLLMLAKQSDSLKNENSPEVEAMLPNKDLSSPSHDFIKKMETENELANAVTSSSGKKTRKRKKQKRNYDQEAVNVQPVSDVSEVVPRRDNLLMLAKQGDSLKNENAPEVEAMQPNRDLSLPSHESIKKLETGNELENVVTDSPSKQKRKRKKLKRGSDILDKSDKDQKEKVVFIQPKSDQCLLISTNQCLELEDTVKNYDQKADSVQPVSEVGPRSDNSLLMGKQMCSLNNENISEVETELPKRYPCPLSSNDFNKEMDTESNQVIEELSTSNKKKRKKKKQKRENDIIDKSDNNQNLREQVMVVQPQSDLPLGSSADKCVEQEDTVSHECQADISGQSVSVVVALGSRIDNSLMLGKQFSSLKNKNTSEVKAVQPNRDHCLSSNDFNTKVDAGSDHGAAELSLSKKKKKKRKKQDDVLDKSDKDQKEEEIIFQPKINLLLQSQANKSLELDDTVKDCVQEAVSVQSVSQVSKLVSQVDNALMLGKEVGLVKNENSLEVEAMQAKRDLHLPSSTDLNKKMGTESEQVNAESSTSNKKKKKRKKQKMGDNVGEKNEKDHDLPDEGVADPIVDPLGTKRENSLMPGKQCGLLKNENKLEGETVQPNRDVYLPSSNDFIKKADTYNDQVDADLSLPNERKRKRKKQKTGSNVPDKSVKDQDVKEKLQGPIPGEASNTKKLLILDINGLLAEIVPYGGKLAYKPDTTISRKAVFKRPFCDDFLQFCFERFDVAVWSSRTKDNLGTAVKFLLGDYRHKLVFCWDQSHCTRTKFYTLENRQKPLVLKELKNVWEKIDPKMSWKRGDYNESNTLLIDDSPYKALRNPAYTAIFPHPYQHIDASDASLGPGGDLRVYLEGLSKAENMQKYIEENPFGQETIKDTDPHWHFYSKILQIN